MNIIIDSAMSAVDAMADSPQSRAPAKIRNALRLLELDYISHDGLIHRGQIVVHKTIKKPIRGAFSDLLAEKVPITKMIPIAAYDWDDEASMMDNNCSSYCFRLIAGKNTPSLHALGLAIDIDPLFNPWIKGSEVQPASATYDPSVPGTLTKDSRTIEIMKDHGFYWGGDWLRERGYVDYQHFDINPYGDSETIIDELRQKGYF